MLLRFDPFHDLNQLAGEILGSRRVPRTMPMDCYRHGDALYLHFELPGIDVETLEVTQEGNTLTVRAVRDATAPEDATFLIDERPGTSYARQLIVGDGLSLDAIAANYQDGVLTLTIPVAEQAQPRRIDVGTGKDTTRDHHEANDRPGTRPVRLVRTAG
ncbi:Hsp20/alpha crystallin family protein [Micromonospora sp. NPDC050795]|uniref:Hsp20/alpha crystallin family protein n=1 Tax=Micromonospora sp. NPDC050795 TaxID=3364282 RepID=UPI0037A67D7A